MISQEVVEDWDVYAPIGLCSFELRRIGFNECDRDRRGRRDVGHAWNPGGARAPWRILVGGPWAANLSGEWSYSEKCSSTFGSVPNLISPVTSGFWLLEPSNWCLAGQL